MPYTVATPLYLSLGLSQEIWPGLAGLLQSPFARFFDLNTLRGAFSAEPLEDWALRMINSLGSAYRNTGRQTEPCVCLPVCVCV